MTNSTATACQVWGQQYKGHQWRLAEGQPLRRTGSSLTRQPVKATGHISHMRDNTFHGGGIAVRMYLRAAKEQKRVQAALCLTLWCALPYVAVLLPAVSHCAVRPSPGTIMQNDWDELYAVLDLLCPYCLGEYGGYVEYYSKPIKRGQSSTASNYEKVKVTRGALEAAGSSLLCVTPASLTRTLQANACTTNITQACRALNTT